MHSTRQHEYKFAKVTRFNLQHVHRAGRQSRIFRSRNLFEFHSTTSPAARGHPTGCRNGPWRRSWSAFAHLTRQLLRTGAATREVFTIA